MPPSLIQRANEILRQLEESREGQEDTYQTRKKNLDPSVNTQKINLPQIQLSIFDAHTETFQEIRTLLEKLDIDRLTPVEALLKLQEVRNLLK